MRTIRDKFRGCDIRFDCFVYLGNFLSSPPKSRQGTGSERGRSGSDGRVSLRDPGDHGVPGGEAANEKPVERPVCPHLFARRGPGLRGGHGERAGLLHRTVRGAGSASSTSARQEGGFYLPGPLNTRVGVDAQGKTGGEPVGMLGLQAGYEGKRQTFGPSEWSLKPAAELEGIHIGQQSPVGDMPITPGVLGTQYVPSP